jgi:hypothetical protein
MKTPAQYRHEYSGIDALDVKSLDVKGVENFKENLVQLENQIALDVHTLSAQYQARAISQLNNTNLKGGKGKAAVEKKLQDEQTARLKPYQDVLEQVKELIKKLE